jgi:hypothetical protein
MTRNLPITAIELEGFQCFEKSTRIEFAPITLLYGPNSAGKSAIFDALELAEEFWNPRNRDKQKINDLVNRWARRSKTSMQSGGRSLRIAIEFPYFEDDDAFLDRSNLEADYKFGISLSFYLVGRELEPGERASPSLFDLDASKAEVDAHIMKKCVRLEFKINTLDDENGQLEHLMLDGYSIDFDGSRLLEAISGRDLCDWYVPNPWYESSGRDTLVRLYDYKIYGDPFAFEEFNRNAVTRGSELADSIGRRRIYRSRSEIESAMAIEPYFLVPDAPFSPWELQDESDVTDDLGSDWVANTANYFEVDIEGSSGYSVYTMKFSNKECSPFSHTEFSNLSSSLSRHVNRLFEYCGNKLVVQLRDQSPPQVSGDRRLPNPEEFTQRINLAKPPRQRSSANAMGYFCELLLRASHASHLMDELPSEKKGQSESPWSDIFQFGSISEETPEFLRKQKRNCRVQLSEEAKLLENVNHVLSSHLFQTKMYQFKGKSELILKFESSTLAVDTQEALEAGLDANVSVVLVDPIQNELTLDDVGSGIGYFLPCIVAFFQAGVVRVQQPELHLHPALQASIGDTLIESLGIDDSQVICETHSEHMLLRILKRIRQQSHSISASDVVAYYFDPIGSDELDGLGTETIVTKQEISPFGDFVHRWPKGFFEERWQELSDD